MIRSRRASAQSDSVIIFARPSNPTRGFHPSTFFALVGSPQQQIDFGRAKVAFINLDVFLPIESELAEDLLEKLANAMRLAGGQDVIVGCLVLQHRPHAFDVVAGESPVALRVEVAEIELLLEAFLDAGLRPG